MPNATPADLSPYLDSNCCFVYQDYYKSIALNPSIKRFVEVGVWKGHSLTFLVKSMLACGKKDIEAWAVDSWAPTHSTYNKFAEMPFIRDIYLEYVQKSGVREYVTDIQSESYLGATFFEDQSLDFVYIDADHRYEYTKRDILAWLPKVKVGGIIAGHDYYTLESERDEPDVKMAVDELVKNGVLKNLSLFAGNVWQTNL